MKGHALPLCWGLAVCLCHLLTTPSQAALAGSRERETELAKCFKGLGVGLGPYFEESPEVVAAHGGALNARLSRIGFDAQPIAFKLSTDLNVMSATVHFNYALSWRDPRINNATFGCSDLLLPHLVLTMFGAARPTETTNVLFGLDEESATKEPGSVTMFVTAQATLHLWEWTYNYFPYDKHVIPLHFVVGQGASVNLLGCEADLLTVHNHFERGIIDLHESAATHGLHIIDDAKAEQALIGGDGGPSSPYQLDHDTDAEWLKAYQFEFVEGKKHTCALDIAIERKPQVFVVKSMAMDFLIAFAGLLALFIDFTIPPMLGGRAGVLMTSMLMTVNSSVRRDLGLGKLDYMVIVDYIGLLNTFILGLALLETLTVYTIHRNGGSTFAQNVDQKIAPAALCSYLFYGAGFILLLATQNETAVAVYGLCVAVAVTGAVVCGVMRSHKHRFAAFDKMATEICEQPGGITDSNVLERAFKLFDADNSGTLEWDELTVLVRAVNRHNQRPFNKEILVGMLKDANLNAAAVQKSGITLDDLSLVLAPTESLLGIKKNQPEVDAEDVGAASARP